ncbi:hypothetical protein B0T10DRAFT_466995 [Thelonectria olida]|uniref:Uncharacterized protein n=1 Tax=Thelonectria olida TaxID=1576542 RepID=A0A9P9AIG7_9HYPO|nr:hypothetical protein B0T10DRAFT_466995 [Thelonectria olida]
MCVSEHETLVTDTSTNAAFINQLRSVTDESSAPLPTFLTSPQCSCPQVTQYLEVQPTSVITLESSPTQITLETPGLTGISTSPATSLAVWQTSTLATAKFANVSTTRTESLSQTPWSPTAAATTSLAASSSAGQAPHWNSLVLLYPLLHILLRYSIL